MSLLDGLGYGSSAWVDGAYRYELKRTWNPPVEHLTFVMLNPSTADASIDDPTIRRCIGFAKRDGWGGIVVWNLYALRATDPAELRRHRDPIGPYNDSHLSREFLHIAREGRAVVAAWGAGADPERVSAVLRFQPSLRWRVLGLTLHGHPRHPLYVRGDAPIVDWERREA